MKIEEVGEMSLYYTRGHVGTLAFVRALRSYGVDGDLHDIGPIRREYWHKRPALPCEEGAGYAFWLTKSEKGRPFAMKVTCAGEDLG